MRKTVILFSESNNNEYEVVVEYELVPAEGISGSSSFDYDLPNWVEDWENAYYSWTILPDQILPPEFEEEKDEYEKDILSQLD
ncbi:hypothetical protein RPMD05_51 [Rhodobacteraceae phage LS06-2018-MD05]|nr:hypothetical protein RPMD05_51 [Rhodobacteraceae phage LS06-2018-MD05]